MPLYRYYFFDIDGEIDDIRTIKVQSDLAAIGQAREFLASQIRHVAIEIWRGDGLVKGVRRDGTSYDPLFGPIHLSV